MYCKSLLILIVVALMSSCVPRAAPTGDDDTVPNIVLTILNSAGAQSFSTDEGETAPDDACAEVQSFPTTLSVAASDEGGVRSIRVRVFPGRISRVSVAPATAEITLDSEYLDISTNPPAGTIQPSVVTTFDVNESTAVVASALDEAGNASSLFQVDVRAQGPVLCRGE